MIKDLFIVVTILFLCTILILLKNLKKTKKENKELKHTIEREKYIEERKEAFIANLTHDLKSPTFAQINSLNLLLNGNFGYLNQEQKEIVTIAKGSCNYVSDLISTIIDTYKCNRGNLYLNKTQFSLKYLIEELERTFVSVANENEQKLILNVDGEDIDLFADELQIKRVMVNMISNAITYGDKNSDILIFAQNKDDKFTFKVQNKCEPISEIEDNTIFKMFQQTGKSKLNSTSSGLGLYLSKQIVDMHEGEIFAKNLENRICEFGFSIPQTTETISNNTDIMNNKVA